MEAINSPLLPPSSSPSMDVKVEVKEEAVDLLEECWFFDNLLDRKARMLRCNSDPCSSSSTRSFGQEMNLVGSNSCVETSAEIRKVLENGGFLDPDSDQAPSPSPPSSVGSEEGIGKKEHDLGLGGRMSKLTRKPPCNGLLRTPSLPHNFGREMVMTTRLDEESSDRDLSKLIRQASINPPAALPPRLTSKGVTQPPTLPRGQPRRIARTTSLNMDQINETKRHRYLNQKKTTKKKSQSDLEIEEVQGFKDLGFKFDKEDLSPSVIDILPGLQEKKKVESDDEGYARRPYLSEAWLAQTPPIPNWVGKKSGEDMKAHIKFWARAVASNVR